MDTTRAMTTDLVRIDDAGALAIPERRVALGRAANRAAALNAFGDYRIRKAPNTLRRQDADLALFAEYLTERDAGDVGDLAHDCAAWWSITWGLVADFVLWMLELGYSVPSVNVRLSTVKTYAGLAAQSGTLPPDELTMIRTVRGYSHKEGKRVDDRRAAAALPTRQPGAKKAAPVTISTDQGRRLKEQPDTPQGRRDRLILALLLDHGLRVGELAGLTVGDINLKVGTMTFWREKVSKEQTHKLSRDAMEAARAYLAQDAPGIGPLLRASKKGGQLTSQGMTTRRISERVRVLGAAVGLAGLSAHDCRHTWATQAARANTPLDRLQDAGGWTSPAMPLRYVEAAKVANDGVRLE